MKTRTIAVFLLLFGVLTGGVSCKKLKKPAAIEEREQWIASFADSIASYNKEIENATDSVKIINQKIEDILHGFSHVVKEREVTGYYIASGWKDRLPLTSTGLVARLNENEKLELIATLKGGVFNRIEASDGSGEVSTKVIPHDQALNYRATGFNTVCFSGGDADTVAQFISDNKGKKITVNYIDGKKTGSFVLSDAEKEMIYSTWQLCYLKNMARQLEKSISFNARRIDICRRMMDREE